MPPAADFWAPRPCFLPPLPELELAIDHLREAADALLNGDSDRARTLVRRADMPIVYQTARMIMGTTLPELHRLRPVEKPPVIERVKARQPSSSVAAEIFTRDGWHCRFCGVRVVSPKARKVMVTRLPDAICWREPGPFHAALYAASATLDHVVPHASGGDNEPANLVTTCWPCNFGRMDRLIEEAGLSDPRERPPLSNSWDGLTRILQARPTAPAAVTIPGTRPQPDMPHADWFAELDRIKPNLSKQLLAFVDACGDLGISWGLKKTFIVRMEVNGIRMQIFGIDPNGDVHIPWAIGAQKTPFRAFAHNLADALPDAVAYESPKMWIVSKASRQMVSLTDLLGADAAVRMALKEFYDALQRSTKQRPGIASSIADPLANQRG